MDIRCFARRPSALGAARFQHEAAVDSSNRRFETRIGNWGQSGFSRKIAFGKSHSDPASGYGQPILTGIRLDDTGLILQGAIPAALLALLAQGGFELVERLVVPKGLRLKPVA